MRYLLDTNFISELRKDNRANLGVQAWAMANDPGLCALSVVTLGEIRRGIEDCRRKDMQQAQVIEQWLESIKVKYHATILPISLAIADRWGRLLSSNQLPPQDLMLAATAIEHDLTVITRNTVDYEGSGARIHNPWK
jgi:predicted nucleic acid-binding protein